jgi:hypothetical protein
MEFNLAFKGLNHWVPLLQWIKQVSHKVILLMDKTCAEYQHNMFRDVSLSEWLTTSILYSVAGLGMIDPWSKNTI